jgi:hypothetical protein
LLLTAAAGIAVVATALAAWQLAFRDTTTPASLDDALARFRAQAATADIPIPPGVYVYATTGTEFVSALGGLRHRYPARSTITVTAGGCGTKLRWDALEHRSNVYEICDEGRRLGAWTETHRFVGRDDVTPWRCESTSWLPEPSGQGSPTAHLCRDGASLQRGTVTLVGEETARVGAATVDVVWLRIDARETGEARGPLVEERWLETETGLPVRIVYRASTLNSSPIGDVRFEERYTLNLVSLEPRR